MVAPPAALPPPPLGTLPALPPNDGAAAPVLPALPDAPPLSDGLGELEHDKATAKPRATMGLADLIPFIASNVAGLSEDFFPSRPICIDEGRIVRKLLRLEQLSIAAARRSRRVLAV